MTIKELQVSKGAVFVTKLRSSGKKRKKGEEAEKPFPATALRATVGASQSLVWPQSRSAVADDEIACKGSEPLRCADGLRIDPAANAKLVQL